MLSMVLEEKQRTLQDHRRKPTLTLRRKKSFAGGMTHQLRPTGLVSLQVRAEVRRHCWQDKDFFKKKENIMWRPPKLFRKY